MPPGLRRRPRGESRAALQNFACPLANKLQLRPLHPRREARMPPTRRRVLLAAAALLSLSGLVLVPLVCAKRWPTPADAARLRAGMTLAEVEGVLGGPADFTRDHTFRPPLFLDPEVRMMREWRYEGVPPMVCRVYFGPDRKSGGE